jgi:hypothetical protein
METKVKELKDDAIVNVKVNKIYYLMLKNTLYYLFTLINEKENAEEILKNILSKTYSEHNDLEKAFYTITLIIAEIEKESIANNFFEEKSINIENIVKQEDDNSKD